MPSENPQDPASATAAGKEASLGKRRIAEQGTGASSLEGDVKAGVVAGVIHSSEPRSLGLEEKEEHELHRCKLAGSRMESEALLRKAGKGYQRRAAYFLVKDWRTQLCTCASCEE